MTTACQPALNMLAHQGQDQMTPSNVVDAANRQLLRLVHQATPLYLCSLYRLSEQCRTGVALHTTGQLGREPC